MNRIFIVPSFVRKLVDGLCTEIYAEINFTIDGLLLVSKQFFECNLITKL
jgi:hypothetical protein